MRVVQLRMVASATKNEYTWTSTQFPEMLACRTVDEAIDVVRGQGNNANFAEFFSPSNLFWLYEILDTRNTRPWESVPDESHIAAEVLV